MEIKENIFRAYDIRGIYGKDLTSQVAEEIGKGFGTFIGEEKEVIVGRDGRIGSEVLKSSLIKGIISVGCNVVDIDIVPTPVVYLAIKKMEKDGGVIITASHNPPEWNGFKLCKGIYLCGEGYGMEEIKDIVLNKKYNIPKKIGSVKKYDFLNEYFNFILPKINIKRKLKIVLDTSNGVTSLIAPKLFKEIGCEITVLNEKIDGNFPGHLPEPNKETLKDLKEKVIETSSDFGVGFDGDGDRAVFVDDKGRILSGSISSIVFIKDILKKKKNAKIVIDIASSSAVEEFIKKNGGIPIIERVGHAFIMSRVIKENAKFGGEESSHFYFKDIYGIDDAVYASLKMAEILSKSSKKLSEIVDEIPKYYMFSTKVKCPDEKKFKVIENLKSKLKNMKFKIIDIDGIKAFKGNDWLLIRASNTEPIIKISCESPSKSKAEKLLEFGKKMVKEEITLL